MKKTSPNSDENSSFAFVEARIKHGNEKTNFFFRYPQEEVLFLMSEVLFIDAFCTQQYAHYFN